MIFDFRIIGTGEEFFPGGYDALPPFMDRYRQLYDFQRMCTLPFEDFLAQMKQAGVSRAGLSTRAPSLRWPSRCKLIRRLA